MEKYKKIDGVWFVTDKNSKLRKVTSKNKLEELNGIDTTKEGKSTLPSFGIGDTIKKITNALGIETCEPCDQRRKEWNKRYPYLNYESMDKLSDYEEDILEKSKSTDVVPYEVAKAVFDMYNKHFKPRPYLEFCQCPGTFLVIRERLSLLSVR